MACLIPIGAMLVILLGILFLALPAHRREPAIRLMARSCLVLLVLALVTVCIGGSIAIGKWL